MSELQVHPQEPRSFCGVGLHGESARTEAGADLVDARPKVIRWQRRIEEWAECWVAQQAQASNCGGGIEYELLVLEIRSERLELVSGRFGT